MAMNRINSPNDDKWIAKAGSLVAVVGALGSILTWLRPFSSLVLRHSALANRRVRLQVARERQLLLMPLCLQLSPAVTSGSFQGRMPITRCDQ